MWSAWNYVLTIQFQEKDDQGSGGGYGAIYNDVIMLTYGNDGEQWRGSLGYIATDANPLFRPAFEVLYVDNTIGDYDGTRFLFVNATLAYKGGFLSHPVRLGRAMGPQGLEFSNPLGFLRPTWNRRLDVWELGGLVDFRLVSVEEPTGDRADKYEILAFPFQLDGRANLFDHFYVGGFHSAKSADIDSSGIMGGFFGKIGFLTVGVGADYDLDTEENRIIVGLIDKF
jgi:hypothetical protein